MTTEQIKDYLHLYLGCPVIVLINGELNTLWGVEQENTVITWNEVWGRTIRHANSIKLLLRPLSDMTDEEESVVCADCLTYKLEHTSVWQALLKSSAKSIAYLLSKHFDLFGLIEAGLAIDLTQQTKVK